MYRWHDDGYVEILIADRTERVRAEPFTPSSSPSEYCSATMTPTSERVARAVRGNRVSRPPTTEVVGVILRRGVVEG